jgi:PKD repeat protein
MVLLPLIITAGILAIGLMVLVHPASASVVTIYPTTDGYAQNRYYGPYFNFSTIRNGTGVQTDTSSDYYSPLLFAGDTSGNYQKLSTLIFSFNLSNTTELPSDAIIDSAILSVHGEDTVQTTLGGTINLTVTGGTLGSNTSIAASDYQLRTDTELANRIENASWIDVGRNNFTINTAGKAYLTTAKSGFAILEIRLGFDVLNSFNGAWCSNCQDTFAINGVAATGTANDPYLEITYHTPSVANATFSTYPMPFINDTHILPFDDTNLPSTGVNVSINATPNTYEWASFVLKPNTTVSGITITTPALSDGAGHTIDASNIDIRLVKVWYQADNMNIINSALPAEALQPELLLKNDSLISVNYTSKLNTINIDLNGTASTYVFGNSTRTNVFPSYGKIFDNATGSGDIQPFSLLTNENRQVWITTHVPAGQATGNYTGSITIGAPTGDPKTVTLTVRVLPFTLVNSTIERAIYYRGYLPVTTPAVYNLTSEEKTEAQYTAELTDIKNHGVLYPVFYNPYYDGTYIPSIERALALRNSAGMPKDHIYMYDAVIIHYEKETSSDPGDLASIAADYAVLKNITNTYGYGDIYASMMDEPSEANVPLLRNASTVVKNAGGKLYVDSTGSRMKPLADIIDVLDLSSEAPAPLYYYYPLNQTELAEYKVLNPNIRLFSYAHPQGGVEYPGVYRQNFGFEIWRSGYSGSMEYAYQHAYGQSIWNDYDDYTGGATYRDHVYAYPKTGGVIDTVQWEGYRQGVDDARYADTLSNITGNKTEATTIINAGIAAGQDMSTIRNTLIDHILAYGSTVHPTASFTKNSTGGLLPITVAFTDTSSDTPTAWNWSFGDGNWTNGTTQNPSYTYSYAGTYQAFLIASNTAGNNQTANQTIIITAPDTTAPRSITGLSNGTVTDATITWQWTNPTDIDFYQVVQYKDGVLYYNSSNTTTAITWTGLTNNTAYTFSSHTIDVSGNMNATWVNATATTNNFPTPPTPTTPASGMTMITQALSILGLLLVVGGIGGIIYSLASISGAIGRGGSSFSTNTFVLAASIITILVGAILLVITYAILSPLATIAGI